MKTTLTAVAAFVVGVTAAQGQPVANVSLIQHNIHSGGRAQAAADGIADLLEMTPQKMLVLCQEANYARQYFNLNYSGWHMNWPAYNFEAKGNPIFARDAAVTVLAQWTLDMQEPWTHLQPKDPRVYTVVKCQLVNAPWVKFHCINVHFPTVRTGNGPARQESVDRLIEASQNLADLPLIICGDFNMDAAEAQQRIADPMGGHLYSNASVDHIILRDGKDVGFGTTDVTVTRLGQLGSDHQALRNNFSFHLLDKVVDNSESGFTASSSWSVGTSAADKYGSDYRFRNTGTVSDPANWAFNIPVAGNYEIFAWWSQGANRSSTAPYILPDSSIVYKNQQSGGGAWQSLGTLNLSAGANNVQLSCWTANGSVVIGDAIKVVPR